MSHKVPHGIATAVASVLACILWALTSSGWSAEASQAEDARFERLAAAGAEKMKEHGVPGVARGFQQPAERASANEPLADFDRGDLRWL
jgi:hypothetical protein